MKKIMIALGVIALAVASQAAQFNWKTAKSGGAVVAGEGITLSSTTAYLFTSDKASTILSAFVAGEDWTAGALNSNTIASTGKIGTTTAFDYSGSELNAVFAMTQTVDGQEFLYISTVASAAAVEVGAATVQFKESAVSTAINDSSKGYVGAGWYGAVPEPTSGLLMLVGLGALALRRRRA